MTQEPLFSMASAGALPELCSEPESDRDHICGKQALILGHRLIDCSVGSRAVRTGRETGGYRTVNSYAG